MKSGFTLITGGSGFIGSHLTRRLKSDGVKTLCLGRSPADALTSWTGTPDLVLHCAGPPTVGAVAADPGADFRDSVLGSLQLLERIADISPSAKIVFCSSAAVYGNQSTPYLSETDCPGPVSAYGTHKLIIELLLKQKCQQLGLQGAIVRLFSVYGEGLRKQLLWDACQKLQKGEHTFMGTGDEARDFIHIDDAVEILLFAAKKASSDCPIVNGGTGQATTVRTLLEQLAECLGAPKPSFNGQANSDNPAQLCADSRRLKSWGFIPRVTLAQGVINYGNWFKEGCP